MKAAARVLFAVIVTASVVYLGDWAVLKFRKDPTGTVMVRPYYAVPRKDKREDYMFDDPHDQTCVNSLFPHQQTLPCWYLKRHTDRRTDL